MGFSQSRHSNIDAASTSANATHPNKSRKLSMTAAVSAHNEFSDSVFRSSIDMFTSDGGSGAMASPLLQLPHELLSSILSFIPPHDLASVAQTCRALCNVAGDDAIWASHVRQALPHPPATPAPAASFRELYQAHHAHWFLPENKIWFADAWPHGRLIVCRYDRRRGCIEGYQLVAQRYPASTGTLFDLRDDGNEHVVYQTFHIRTRLDLNAPILHLKLDDLSKLRAASQKIPEPEKPIPYRRGFQRRPQAPPPAPVKRGIAQRECQMDLNSSLSSGAGAFSRTTSSLARTINLPRDLQTSQTQLWPPLNIPSVNAQRTRNASPSSFQSNSHRPTTLSQASTATFRIRQAMNFGNFAPVLSSPINALAMSLANDQITTYATLSSESYMPTATKPWQGIWVGDYSSHGAEFLLITQPDEHIPLPEKAARAFKRWPHTAVHYDNILGMQMDDDDNNDGDNEETEVPASTAKTGDNSPKTSDTPFRGQLFATKLTGDPNVPRGEYTFIAADLGDAGHVGQARDAVFREKRSMLYKQHYSLTDPSSTTASTQSWSTSQRRQRRSDMLHRRDSDESNSSDSSSSSSFARDGTPATSDEDVIDSASVDSSDEDEYTHFSRLPAWHGARMVRAVGHIGETNFTRDAYIPSQLILVSENTIAQWWRPWGHVSFYRRVDWEQFCAV